MKFFLPVLLLGVVMLGHTQSKTFSFVFLNKKTSPQELPKEEVEKIMKGHMDNIDRLAKEGKLIAAGPFEGGGGIFILNTTSIDEAKQWLSTDPGVKANRWDIEVLTYTPRMGAVCAAKEPYEMVTYQFVRFLVNRNFATDNADRILQQHQQYLQSLKDNDSVITEGFFSDSGSILVVKGDLERGLLDADPAIKQGIVSVDIRKLWIAKGSFCEH